MRGIGDTFVQATIFDFSKAEIVDFLVGSRRELAHSTHCDAADPVVAAASDEGALSETPFSTLCYFTTCMDM